MPSRAGPPSSTSRASTSVPLQSPLDRKNTQPGQPTVRQPLAEVATEREPEERDADGREDRDAPRRRVGRAWPREGDLAPRAARFVLIGHPILHGDDADRPLLDDDGAIDLGLELLGERCVAAIERALDQREEPLVIGAGDPDGAAVWNGGVVHGRDSNSPASRLRGEEGVAVRGARWRPCSLSSGRGGGARLAQIS